jgi:hypothetical protein
LFDRKEWIEYQLEWFIRERKQDMDSTRPTPDMFDPEDLQEINPVWSEQGNFFSLFLDLRNTTNPDGAPILRFEKLLQQVKEQKNIDQKPTADQDEWWREADQIRGWLETERVIPGQGLVLFSSREQNFWRAFFLPVPVFDRLVVYERAFLRPLNILLGEAKRTLYLLLDSSMAQFFEMFFGKVEEISRIQALPVTGTRFDDEQRAYARSIAGKAEEIWKEHGFTRLVTGGSADLLPRLHEELPEDLRSNLAGEVDIMPAEERKDNLIWIYKAENEFEQNLETQRVEELLSSAESGDAAVLGAEQALMAVKRKKARLLVVEEDFHQEGGECPNCGYLSEGEPLTCQLCGMALRPEPDIIEVALKRVLDYGGEIEILRSQENRQVLSAHGRIGALLHDTHMMAPEKETANQLPITRDGDINHEGLHDEVIQESFPASDPPSR